MAERRQPSSKEAAERELSVKSSAELAKALGLTRNTAEKERWYREYWKPVDSGGYITLAFQDDKYGEGGERIVIGVKRSSTSPKNDKQFDLCQDKAFDKAVKKLSLTKNDNKMFLKSELKESGYTKLYYFLLELEESGFYTDLLKSLQPLD